MNLGIFVNLYLFQAMKNNNVIFHGIISREYINLSSVCVFDGICRINVKAKFRIACVLSEQRNIAEQFRTYIRK